MRKIIRCSVLLLLLTTSTVFAQVPQTISYRGILTNTDGNPVANGNANLTFKLYEFNTGGTPIWQETQEVALSNGVFSAILGSSNPLGMPFDNHSLDAADGDPINVVFVDSKGKVGIGTTTPNNLLDVDGNAVIGNGYAGKKTISAPTNGLLVQGKVGIGTTTPNNLLDVDGNAVIGNGYAGKTAISAPTNGLLVQGKVGIGNTDPQSLLHVGGDYTPSFGGILARIAGDLGVNGTIVSDKGSLLSRAPTGTAILSLDAARGTGGHTWQLLSHADNNPYGVPGGTFTIYSTQHSKHHFTLDASGNVGIGITNPDQPLDVAGDIELGGGSTRFDGASEALKIKGRSDTWYAGVQNETTISASDFFIGKSATEDGTFHIQNDGNVGIGTNSPQAKLDVNGDVRWAPKTSHVVVWHTAFIPNSGSNEPFVHQITDGISFLTNVNFDSEFSADLSLPHGAEVSRVTSFFDDKSSSEDIEIKIFRVTLADASVTELVDVSSTGIETSHNVFKDFTVDNATFAYFIDLFLPNGGGGAVMNFHGVRVTYTISEPY